MLRPDKDARLLPGDLRSAYVEWCAAADREPLPVTEIAPALGQLLKMGRIELVDGAAVGVAVRSPASGRIGSRWMLLPHLVEMSRAFKA